MRRSSTVLAVSLVLALSCNNPDKNDTVTIGFVGDVLLDRGVRTEISKRGVGNFYEDLSDQLVETDYLIGNLECPLTEDAQPVHKRYVFRADTLNAGYLRAVGFTHLSLANNHSYDQSRVGMVTTANTLRFHAIEPLGYSVSQSNSCSPSVITQNGVTISVFSSVTLALENWYPNPSKPGMCQERGVDLIDRVKDYAQRNESHHIVVYLHWGIEHSQEASPDQKVLARGLVDAGADLIIGHHPHVLQPHELYMGKHIFFSVGNFIFDQEDAINAQTQLIKVKFGKEGYEVESVDYRITDCLPVRLS